MTAILKTQLRVNNISKDRLHIVKFHGRDEEECFSKAASYACGYKDATGIDVILEEIPR